MKTDLKTAVDKIMANPKLTGYQKATRISNLIKKRTQPKEANDNDSN